MSRPRRWVGAWLVTALWVVGCSPKPPTPPRALIQGDAQAVRSVLERLLVLENTPTAHAARRGLQALETCHESFEASSAVSNLDLLLDHIECRPTLPELGDRSLVFRLPLKALDGGIVEGELRLKADGALDWVVRLPDIPKANPISMMLPASEGATPRLSSSSALFHSRWRSRHGFDFAAMVEEGSELDRLWGLRAEVLSSAVLDGTAELVVYLPEEGRVMPSMAAALGIRSRRAATVAADTMSEKLASTWSVPRSRFRVGEHDGLCLTDLKMLPDLSPCYLVTDHQLVVGWNASSLRTALAAPPADEPANQTTVRFGLFPEADRRIAAIKQVDVQPVEYPWSRLTIIGTHDGSGYRFDAELQ